MVAVPPRDDGYAVGIVARANSEGVLLGYFFGPRRNEVPSLADVADLDPHAALLVRTVGHLGLRKGAWQIMGAADDWCRGDWPVPAFVRYEEFDRPLVQGALRRHRTEQDRR